MLEENQRQSGKPSKIPNKMTSSSFWFSVLFAVGLQVSISSSNTNVNREHFILEPKWKKNYNGKIENSTQCFFKKCFEVLKTVCFLVWIVFDLFLNFMC